MNATESVIMFVDRDHSGGKVSYRLRNVFLIHVSTNHVQWFYKKNQFTVDASAFGAEFINMKQPTPSPPSSQSVTGCNCA